MQSRKDQSAPRARPALSQRLSRLLHLRRQSWASAASAEENGTPAPAAGAATSTPAPQQQPAGPTSTAAAPPRTNAATVERVAKPIVDTDMPTGPPPKEPTLSIALPDDPRVEHRFATLNGVKYHYLYAEPSGGKWKTTVFLIHGWPDISAGWRFQIPLFLRLGLRVVAPDMMGYGRTEAPKVPPNDLRLYSTKRAADDIKELVKQLGEERIVLGGHDWGGMVVWRTILWHPEIISHVFSVCTAYTSPSKNYMSVQDLVRGPVPQFGYQLHLASGEVEEKIKSKEEIRQFLSGMYGGRGPDGQLIFNTYTGVLFENVPIIRCPPLMSHSEINYYAEEWSRNGLHGTLNWYRTRKVNWEDDLALKVGQIQTPSLFIAATKDQTLRPEMAANMERHFKNLTRGDVVAGHWALWEAPAAVNKILEDWFEKEVFTAKAAL